MAREPGFPWLAAGDAPGLQRVLGELGWLKPGERVLSSDRAGEGNMNLTLRIVTDQRSFILKQARPWVEKYPDIEAPWDRSQVEQTFYARVASVPAVADRMPRIFGRSPSARIIVMEDLADARDLTSLYRDTDRDEDAGADAARGRAPAGLTADEVHELADYLCALHERFTDEARGPLQNREMRALNHQHIYVVPLDADNGLALDDFEPGLAQAARRLQDDEPFRDAAVTLGRRYLADGHHLVHGDFFPGSWLRTTGGLRIIDPEFAFYGDAELDVACAIAHFALASLTRDEADRLLGRYADGRTGPALRADLLARYAAIEVVRRLIGVAQLPIAPSRGARAALLERARNAMLDGRHETLFE